jgi:DNA-binding winged helix-turn-helix (wHTH) protein/tetratricopeptide (TPR) repeat protein
MPPVQDQVFTFGEFTLAPQERLLLCNQQPVHLTPKAFDLLVTLVRHSGHLVTKDDLLREVWPDTFVEEVNLTVHISGLRKALDRGGTGSAMIETVPTRGYRFVAPVTAGNVEVVLYKPGVLGSRQGGAEFGRQPTKSADAYRAYIQGRHEWNQRSKESVRRGIEYFQRAVDIDPQFAAAYSGLADCYATLGYLSYASPSEAFPPATQHAATAVELDASLAEPHASMGFVKLYFKWDWPGAEVEFKRAIAVDPNYAATHEWYSIYLLAAGRASEALREIQLARMRDPLSLPINSDLGFHYYYNGQYDEAVKQLKFVLEMKKDFPPAHLWLGRTYQELGRFDDALAEFHQVEASLPQWPVTMAARGFVAAVAGHQDEARQILAELERLAGRTYVTPYGVALVHAGLGSSDAALAWLKKAFEERSHWLVWLRLDPRWNRLRLDPQFAELVSRMRFPG